MPLVPPMPSFDSLHPLVVHFPVALLLVAPVLVVAGLIPGRSSRGLSMGALGLMAMGTVAAWVSVATGEAAGQMVDRTPGMVDVLSRHAELAELTRNLFTALTAIYGLMTLTPMALHRELRLPANLAVHGAFLLLYAGAATVLANTAHQGGTLVHKYGVHCNIDEMEPSPAIVAVATHAEANDSDD